MYVGLGECFLQAVIERQVLVLDADIGSGESVEYLKERLWFSGHALLVVIIPIILDFLLASEMPIPSPVRAIKKREEPGPEL